MSTSAEVKVPSGWIKSGSRPENYEMGVDPAVEHAEKVCAVIKFIGTEAEGFGTLMQTFKADDYRKKRVRVSAWMRTDNAGFAGLWMRVDGIHGEMVGFANFENRPVTGTTEWREYDLVLDVIETAGLINLGALLAGKGQAWMSGFRFEVVNVDVPVTSMNPPDQKKEEKVYPDNPLNLDFEN